MGKFVLSYLRARESVEIGHGSQLIAKRSEGLNMKKERYFIESSYQELWTKGVRKHPINPFHKDFIGTLRPSDGDIVLEVGTGEGRFIPLIVREEATYVGIDISMKALKYAKDWLGPKNENCVHLVVAEAKHLPFTSKSVNKSFCYATIFYIPDKKLVIKEMKRVSKGKILIEFRNIFSPRYFLRFLRWHTLIFLLTIPLTRKLLLTLIRFIPFHRKDLWTKTALKDEKLVLEPRHFPDSPSKILSYFNTSVKIYSASRSKLKRHYVKREWLFKPGIIVEVDL